MAEGEPGERFYIIAARRARAAKDGQQLREMGAGDSFGEIALLRRKPGTATVMAMSRVEARILAREEVPGRRDRQPGERPERRRSYLSPAPNRQITRNGDARERRLPMASDGA